MKCRDIKKEILQCGVSNYLEKVMTIEKKRICFEKSVIKHVYLFLISEIRKFSIENDISECFLNSLKENSQKLFEEFEKEINSINLSKIHSSTIEEGSDYSTLKNIESDSEKNTANVIIFLTDNKEKEIQPNKKEDNPIKRFLLNAFQSIGILSVEIDQGDSIRENFIKDIFVKIPDIGSSKKLISTIEEIFEDLEIDLNLLANIKTNQHENIENIDNIKKIEKNKKSWFDVLKNQNQTYLSLQNNNTMQQNIHIPSLPIISRRKTSCDKSETSVDKNREKEEKNNFTIDKYFKPIDRKLCFSNIKITDKKKEPRPSININSVILNKLRETSLNNNEREFSNSFKDLDNFKTKNSRTSVKSIYSEDLDGMSMNSNSKKNSSLLLDGATINSNLFNTEYSKISYESNLRRININNTISTPCHGYNSFHPHFSSGKSSFSQNSLNVSHFSFNPTFSMKSFNKINQTPNENSNNYSNLSNNNTLSRGNSLSLNSSVIKQGGGRMGINSLLAAKIRSIPKTRKNSEINSKIYSSGMNSSNKKRKNTKVLLIQKIMEKCGRNSGMKSNEKNRLKRTPTDKERKSLKNIIGSSFYNRQNYLIKSPDAVEKRLSYNRNLEKTRESTQKNKEKIREDKEEPNNHNDENKNENIPHKEVTFLNVKRLSDRKEERRVTRALAKKGEQVTKRGITRSSEKSITDDEVLVYQTPVKTSQMMSLGDLKSSPGITTRKNLFNLFQQIDKSA